MARCTFCFINHTSDLPMFLWTWAELEQQARRKEVEEAILLTRQQEVEKALHEEKDVQHMMLKLQKEKYGICIQVEREKTVHRRGRPFFFEVVYASKWLNLHLFESPCLPHLASLSHPASLYP